MEEIRKICKRFGIPVPEENNLEQPNITDLFNSYVNLAAEPYYEFKKSSNIVRALTKRKLILPEEK